MFLLVAELYWSILKEKNYRGFLPFAANDRDEACNLRGIKDGLFQFIFSTPFFFSFPLSYVFL